MAKLTGTVALTKVLSGDFSNPSLVSLDAREGLGELYSFELTFAADNEVADLEPLLGHQMTLHAFYDDHSAERFYHGYIVELSQEGWTGSGRSVYRALLKPWLWFLTQTNDCRIFQEQAVPDIISQVFSDHGFTDFDLHLFDEHVSRKYCLQYRESDFNFVSRLMQEEGIYYFFEHMEGSHKLILTDSGTSHLPLGQSTVPFFQPTDNAARNEMNFDKWVPLNRVKTGAVALNSYDFKKPKASLLTNHLVQRSHDFADYEKYDYPGKYFEFSEGEQFARIQAETFHANAEAFSGHGNVLDCAPGYTFTLKGHPVGALDIEYAIVTTQHSLKCEDPDFRQTTEAPAYFHVNVRCISNEVAFRPEPTARKPVISGPQHALVVGPGGEEIYVDEHGRIKVQFYWDRYGQKDENSTCWIRVAQFWAGSGWGAQFIPRIGHEVVVDFFEGDPDRPVVTGSVYNADNMPPYSLPDNKTQSGIKTRSSPGGSPSNYNEIRFEDKAGSEELYIQAEKDENILVKDCKSETVQVDESITIGNDRTETVGNNETLTVGVDRTRSVGSNETVSVGENQTISVAVNRTRNVGSNETVNIGKTRMHNVGINESINIGAAQEIAIGGLQAVEIGGLQNVDVGLNQSIGIGKDQNLEVGGDRKTEIGDDDDLKVGKKLVIEAGDSITLKCGRSSITMKKDGTIQIQGKNLLMKASGKVSVKASSDVKIKGSKVQAN